MKIDWYCPAGTGLNVFTDGSPENKGVGGAEASVVYLTRAWAKLGHEVTVYGDITEPMSGHGVRYMHTGLFSPTADRDIFILHRTPAPKEVSERVNAKVKVFFSCDQRTVGNWSSDVYPYVDKIITISPYHNKYLYLYQNALKSKMWVTNLGVKLKDYKKNVKKKRFKMIFCSVPDRGLPYALDFFQQVRAQIPEATLVVTSDHTLWGVGYTGLSPVLMSAAKGAPGVEYLGNIPRKDLIKHQQESEIMFYPCCYDENFCISAAECQYAGAIPVTANIGAMSTTVKHNETGLVLDSTPFDPNFGAQFVKETVDLLQNEARMDMLRAAGIARATAEFDWDVIANNWLELFSKIKEDKYGS